MQKPSSCFIMVLAEAQGVWGGLGLPGPCGKAVHAASPLYVLPAIPFENNEEVLLFLKFLVFHFIFAPRLRCQPSRPTLQPTAASVFTSCSLCCWELQILKCVNVSSTVPPPHSGPSSSPPAPPVAKSLLRWTGLGASPPQSPGSHFPEDPSPQLLPLNQHFFFFFF